MTPAEELELRRKQLKARDDRSGFRVNVEMLKERIAELEAMIGGQE